MWKTTAQPASPRRASRMVPVMRVLGAPPDHDAGAPRVFDQEQVLVGRAVGDRGLAFPRDERVSRQHAVIDFDAESRTATISDTSSRSGTFVDGQRVASAPLPEGKVVRVGDSFFLFRFEMQDELALGDPECERGELVGCSPAMRTLRRTLQLVGKTRATVIILGESGTGKELAARALHERSGRTGPFVAVNCAAIPEQLVESQFFGHLAGAFTSARADSKGWFRTAEGGTLFLDELGELPLSVQPKLLRALEERAVVPVGATHPIRCDARIVAATNRDLGDRARFRGDLFARISDFVLEMPPLRTRPEDVLPILMRMFGPREAALDPELISALLLHDYPHNARDLRRIAAQLQVRGAGRARWDVALLDGAVLQRPPSVGPREPPAGERVPSAVADTRAPTRDELIALLAKHRGSVADVARDAQRSRKQVYRWVEQHGLTLEAFRTH